MRLFFVTFILISSHSKASWEEQDCNNIFSKSEQSQNRVTTILSFNKENSAGLNKWKNIQYRVQAWFQSDSKSCAFIIRSRDQKRVYSFNPSGEFSFTNTKTEVLKTFFHIPKKNPLKLFINNKSGEIKIELPNTSVVYFDPKTGKFDDKKTTDFKIDQSQSNELILSESKNPLVTFLARDSNLNSSIALEKGEQSCKLKASQLYNYLYTCDPRKINGGFQYQNCDASVENIKNDIIKEKGSYSSQDINGVSLKNNYQDILESLSSQYDCPDVEVPSSSSKKISPSIQIDCPKKLMTYFSTNLDKNEVKQYIKDLVALAIMKVVQMAKTIGLSKEKNIDKDLNLYSDPRLEKSFLEKESHIKLSPVYIKILALQYEFNKLTPSSKSMLTLADLKILKIFIKDSEQDNQNFHKVVNQLLDLALKNKKTSADNPGQYKILEEKITKAQERTISYLISQNCFYENQFSDCAKPEIDLTKEFLFEDSQKVLEFLYENLIKLSL